jgi:hydroxymethylglutaryl-CoA lyase
MKLAGNDWENPKPIISTLFALPLPHMEKISIVECPRDAMQGWPHMIPTERKISYLNRLLKAGFDVIDFGSFVSPKAIPQMADTAEVLRALDLSSTRSRLLAIVANKRGAEQAASCKEIHYLGFPFSVSETFQQRNTNTSLRDSFRLISEMQELCVKGGKELVVYLSMGFGNPYGDPYSPYMVMEWAEKIAEAGVRTISIADTVGLASPELVSEVMTALISRRDGVVYGVHLHAAPAGRAAKLQAALDAGCRRFDGALRGIGGCPMAGNDLIGNMDTEFMLNHFGKAGFSCSVDPHELALCSNMAAQIFI